MAIGAIQTEYAGHLFRSRLEARWAVFFDRVGVEWRYETEGYEGGGHRYLPDFYLPKVNAWVEVKGSDEAMFADAPKVSSVLCSGALPGFIGGGDGTIEKGERQGPFLMLLGEVPLVGPSEVVLHPAIQHVSGVGLVQRWCCVCTPDGEETSIYLDRESLVAIFIGLRWSRRIDLCEDKADWSVAPQTLRTGWGFQRAMSAYEAARFARFEFGAKGGV